MSSRLKTNKNLHSLMNGNIYIKWMRIVVFFALLPIYSGSMYLGDSFFRHIFYVCEFGLGGLAFFYLGLKTYQKSLSIVSTLLLIIYAYLIINTFICQADTQGILKQAFFILYIVLIFDFCHEHLDDLFACLQLILGFLIIGNVISLVLFPEGLARVIVPEGGGSVLYFMGHDNSNILYMMPCFIASEARILDKGTTNKGVYYKSRLLQIIIIINIILTRVGLTIIWMLSFVIIYNFLKSRLLNSRLNTVLMIVIPIVLNIVVVVFQKNILIIDYIATNFLGKTTTYSGRAFVWIKSIKLIKQSFINGYGYYSNNMMPQLLGYQQAHNLLLQIMLVGGLILAIGYVFLMVLIIKKALTIQHTMTALCRTSIICYLIYMVGESQFNYKMMLIIPLIWQLMCCYDNKKLQGTSKS